VLADINAGHWIRYHSECSVIGDEFLLTPIHMAKALEREPLAPDAKLPPQYGLRGEARTPGGQLYGRLYEIERGP